MTRIWARTRRPATIVAVAAALTAGVLATTGSASADTAPPAGTPATVTADSLPTMQINGVVWAQVVVGNTVYATGNFTQARPAGAAPGTNQTAVGNIVAYDITTGKMIPSFIHTLNAQGLGLAASPDGSRLYVGGDFTTVDGAAHSHIAAFNAQTGALDTTFKASVTSEVRAVAATNSTVYAGGSFLSAGGSVARNSLAAFTSAGALTTWAPKADNVVLSMVMSPDQSRVIVAGHFATLSGVTAHGMGSINATTAAIMPWSINTIIGDWGDKAAIDTLSTDGKLIYGGGYTFNSPTENFEGRFAADPNTGNLVWVNDCQGDTYGAAPVGGVLYSVGHSHDCDMVNSFPNLFPAGEQWHRAMAETTAATQISKGPDMYGWNFNGKPAATVLDWFPNMTAAPASVADAPAGTVAVSGAVEAGWTVTGNAAGTYVLIGGEGLKVNNVGQQGLARFAVKTIAPHIVGPDFNSVVKPTITAGATAGTATVSIKAAWDRDNQNLTYKLTRDGASTPVYTTTLASTFWQLPTASFTDTGLAAGTHTYQLQVLDPDGNWVKISNTVTITNGAAGGNPPPAPVNLALNKVVTVSKVYTGSTINAASNAVDGDVNTLGLTDTGPQAWLQVDLGASQVVSKISFLGRSKCCTDESADFWVFASNTPFNHSLLPAAQAKVAGVWSSYQAATATPAAVYTLPAGSSERYIMIQHGGTDYLGVNELTVN